MRQFGVPEFHSNDFFGGKGQYRGWEGSHRDSLLDSLLSVLGSSRVIPLGCAIHRRDFLGLTRKERRVLSGAYNRSRLTLRRGDTSQPFEARIERKLEGPDAEKQAYRVGFKYFLGAVASKSPPSCGIEPVFPISGVFWLKGQPKRDSGIRFKSCKASQSPVYPTRDAILAVNHASCPSLSSSCPCQCGETALKTRRLPGALSLSWQNRGCTLPQLGAGDNRPIRSSTPWNNRRGTDTSDN